MRQPFVGAGSAWRGRGVWRRYAIGTGKAPGGRMPHNYIRNSGMLGVVAGSPGTLPTNWVMASLSGLSRQVIGSGHDGTFPYVDVKYSGTAGATFSNSTWINFEGAASVAAASGQVWTASLYASLVGGSMANATLRVRLSETNGSTSLANSSQSFTPTSAAQRISVTRVLNNAATTHVQPMISIDVASGAAIDFTVRIWAPQVNRGAVAASPVVTVGAAVAPASVE